MSKGTGRAAISDATAPRSKTFFCDRDSKRSKKKSRRRTLELPCSTIRQAIEEISAGNASILNSSSNKVFNRRNTRQQVGCLDGNCRTAPVPGAGRNGEPERRTWSGVRHSAPATEGCGSTMVWARRKDAMPETRQAPADAHQGVPRLLEFAHQRRFRVRRQPMLRCSVKRSARQGLALIGSLCCPPPPAGSPGKTREMIDAFQAAHGEGHSVWQS